MRKKLLLASLILVVITTMSNLPKARAATPVVEVSKVVVTEPGTTFLVNITVKDVSDLLMWIIDMTWDPNITKITTGDPNGLLISKTRYGVYQGPFLKSIRSTIFCASTKIDNTKGKITLLNAGYASSGQTPSGDGLLATINFTLINNGTTTLDITGPSVAQPGHSMLIDHFGNEIYHDDIDGAVWETEPITPIWTQLWFQVTMVGIVVVIVAVVYVAIKRKPIQHQ